jgi:hypothetical protein
MPKGLNEKTLESAGQVSWDFYAGRASDLTEAIRRARVSNKYLKLAEEIMKTGALMLGDFVMAMLSENERSD